MQVHVLGTAEVRIGGVGVDLGTRKQRALLAALVMHHGASASPDTLADLIWGDAAPTALAATLQGYVARLRRALEPDRPPRAPSRLLVTTEAGYCLRLPDGSVDADRFEQAVLGVHRRLTGDHQRHPRPVLEAALAELDEALALWRGSPYAELDAPAALAERARLEELRLVALEDRAALWLALGRHATAVAELEVLTASHPLRERLWALRATALARSGRQADALQVLREVRGLLRDELGLEPGAALREVQAAVLRQDPSLDRAPVVTEFPTPPAGPRVPDQPWPLVGRDELLTALTESLTASASRPTFAALTGEPGIGKSRLCAELARVAEACGVTVLVGRCSQDDGAPPLYPWASVLGALGHDLPTGGHDDTGSRFRAWEEMVDTLLAESERRHLLVILDDLHWADTSTLKVLRLLAETAQAGRLMVVATWRADPPASAPLAEVAEMLARRHALRLELDGLSADETAALVSAVASADPTTAQAEGLRERTDGNPFFLVEFARLARDRGDLDGLLAEEDLPVGVQDVLTRRMAALPARTSGALRAACVLGRAFDVPTLAKVLDEEEDQVLDDLDPALASGLVREQGVDRLRFAHALVRDTAYRALPQSRRARIHVRAAEVLEGAPRRESEVARHWSAAGPQHAARAWRAGLAASRAARRVFAHDEAVALAAAAVAALAEDPQATPQDEHTLLIELATAYQRTGNWVDLRPVIHRALVVADGADDLDRLVQAAALPITHALWQTTDHGQVDEVIVEVMRRALDRLPSGDSPHRCRLMLALAGEIYYGATSQEREALVEEAVAMARRLADDELLLWALLAAPICIWRKGTAARRLELSSEAARLAAQRGDGMAESSAVTLQLAAAGDLGLFDTLPDLMARAAELAAREHHLYAELVLAGVQVPLLAMRGEFEQADELLARMGSLHERMSLMQSGDAVLGATLMRLVWSGHDAELRAVVEGLDAVTALPTRMIAAAMLCRVGELDRAREEMPRERLEESGDWWFSPMQWATAAEAAAYTRDPEVGAQAYALLAPYAGQPACAGSGSFLGPVDAFLALAAHATGERDLAARHAHDAVRLCREWQLPLAEEWFARAREEVGLGQA